MDWNTSMEKNSEALLTTKQVAELLQLKPATLEQWRWTGRGPEFIKLNRAVRYRRSAVEAFTNARAFTSTTAAQHGTAAGGSVPVK
jgi:predicted DNA-binding transcriptional regulator AlpA